jgi:hypothetical protein
MTDPDKVKALVTDMFGQSLAVMTNPSVDTFERFEKRGGFTEALTYVVIGAIVVGLIGLVSGAGFIGSIKSIIGAILGFLAFSFVTHFVGKSQGGTGTFDEVAYTFSLFWMPISILGGIIGLVITLLGFLTFGLAFLLIPLVALAMIGLNIFYAYTATKSSMNLYQNDSRVWITLVAAGFATFLVRAILF